MGGGEQERERGGGEGEVSCINTSTLAVHSKRWRGRGKSTEHTQQG